MAFKGVPVVKAPYRVFVGQKFDVSGSWWGKSFAKGDEGKTYNMKVTEVDEARSDKKLFKVRLSHGENSQHMRTLARFFHSLFPIPFLACSFYSLLGAVAAN